MPLYINFIVMYRISYFQARKCMALFSFCYNPAISFNSELKNGTRILNELFEIIENYIVSGYEK